MINLKKSDFHVQWSVVAGIILLIIAFFILATSGCSNNRGNNSVKTVATKTLSTVETETTTDNTEQKAGEETTTDNTEQATTKEATTEPETTVNPKKLIDFDAEHPYLIRVNRAENFAVVYGTDEYGNYSVPYKTFVCSTGLEEDDTPLGVFHMSDKYRWRLMVDGTYAQYAIRIHGQIMLHSVPYLEASNDTLEYWEYNKLGQAASLGCIRFRAAAIKWIYDNCSEGATVIIYSEPGEEPPIPLKKIEKIKKSNPNSGWDPTDPDKDNPWKKNSKKAKKKYKVESNDQDFIAEE